MNRVLYKFAQFFITIYDIANIKMVKIAQSFKGEYFEKPAKLKHFNLFKKKTILKKKTSLAGGLTAIFCSKG